MNIAVVGTGYVGLVSGTCFAEMGNHVTCVDIDADKVAALQNGHVPIYEPGLETFFARGVREGRLRFTTELAEAVETADVILNNPTHLSVALKYDREQGGAPRVVAKGADKLAKEIRRIARREGVITLENKPLARALFKAVKVGGEVPPDLYQAVASVLAFVYRVRGRR